MATTIRVIAPTRQPDAAGFALLADAPQAEVVANVPTAGTSPKKSSPNPLVVLASFAAVGIAWWVAVNLIHDPTFGQDASKVKVVEGLSIFAAFFIAALGVERLLEPLTKFLGVDAKDNLAKALDDATSKVAAAGAAWKQFAESPNNTDLRTTAEAANTEAQSALDSAAGAQAAVAEIKGNKGVAFWAIATGVAIIASSWLKLYLLEVVGVARPPRALEILATGLIIGAGTKPLHDIVELIQAKKDASKDQAAATTGAS